MCVESVTTGLPQHASTLNRPGSTSILSTDPPVLAASFVKMAVQVRAYSALILRDRFDIDQRPG